MIFHFPPRSVLAISERLSSLLSASYSLLARFRFARGIYGVCVLFGFVLPAKWDKVLRAFMLERGGGSELKRLVPILVVLNFQDYYSLLGNVKII